MANILLTTPAISRKFTISQRTFQAASAASQTKLTIFVSDGKSSWKPQLASLSLPPVIFNVVMAHAAKEAGVRIRPGLCRCHKDDVYCLLSNEG
jgi:hypothetical protein